MPQAVLQGLGLIVTKASRETVFDLTEEGWAATFRLLHRVKAHLDEIPRPDSYNVGWNGLPVGDQSIPRFRDEPLVGKGIRYRLKQPVNK